MQASSEYVGGIAGEEKIKIMEEQGVSQYRLSKMTGISAKTISDWRSKKTNLEGDPETAEQR